MQLQPLPILTLREGAIIAGAAVAVILFLWFLARLSHRPYVISERTETAQMTLAQLGRIADAMDRLARSVENKTTIEERHSDAPTEEKHHAMSLSMFGR